MSIAQALPIHMANGFLQSASKNPDNPALLIGSEEISYASLKADALTIAGTLLSEDTGDSKFVLVLAHKSRTAHSAVIGSLIAGYGYVPLNPAFPSARNRSIMELSGAGAMVVGKEAEHLLADLLAEAPPMRVLLPDANDVSEIRALFPLHVFLGKNDFSPPLPSPQALPGTPDEIAYLLFTSGSTGIPKGVPVSHNNGCSFIRYMVEQYATVKEDRIAQTSDLTFDFSVQPMFMAWEAGSCLCVVQDSALMAPVQYIRKNNVTIWISVPSVILFADRLRLLKPEAMPSVRLSMFCGEPLTAAAARAWSQSTSNGKLVNLYGPTEATVAITHYEWQPDESPRACEDGVVPIGWMFAGQRGVVVNEHLVEVDKGTVGEFLLAGPQVTKGYLNNPSRTAQQYVTLPDDPQTLWYKTGDLVRMGEDDCLYYKGRSDDQVQIRGYRVVLQEITCALKEAAETDMAAVIAWPLNQGRADAVYGFISSDVTQEEMDIIDKCRKRLPSYMIPKAIIKLDTLPLSGNGKIDRKALTDLVKDNSTSTELC